MPKIAYGETIIEYAFEENDLLKAHYIDVEPNKGVTLRGKRITPQQADAMILKKAAWILTKLELVRLVVEGDIVTGSRLPYLGKRYYVSVAIHEELRKVKIEFTHSKFNISLPPHLNTQKDITIALLYFYRERAIEKLTPRLKDWASQMEMKYQGVTFRKMHKQWGSCSPLNAITINTDAVKLPWSLIDYLLVHELAHIRHKNHSKEFWALVSQFIPNFHSLDQKLGDWKF